MVRDQKIEICKKTRAYAQECLVKVMKKVLAKDLTPSEIEIRDMWLSELRKNNAILPDGWYSPPPNGIGVLIGTDNDREASRLNYKSMRPEEIWPRDDVRLNTKNGIIYAYASPVDRETGIIGDFGVTLYFGKKKEIINHLVLCYGIVRQVFEYVESGMTFSQIAEYMKVLIGSLGLNNEIEARTSPAPADDVGHTIPFIMENITEEETVTLASGNQNKINKMISEKRIFVRAGEEQIVKKGMAFTIEPRPKVIGNPKIPMVSLHSICAFRENGKKELLTNFNQLFDLAGMSYMK
ncbi:MAG: hypothetical protein WCW25_01530 [Patescibacteria group bacterium]|jgi:hypothetical protein